MNFSIFFALFFFLIISFFRAAKLEKLLKASHPDLSVVINKEKPRKGCFEVRAHGKAVVTFGPGMPRPFAPLRNAEMEDVADKVTQAIQS